MSAASLLDQQMVQNITSPYRSHRNFLTMWSEKCVLIVCGPQKTHCSLCSESLTSLTVTADTVTTLCKQRCGYTHNHCNEYNEI